MERRQGCPNCLSPGKTPATMAIGSSAGGSPPGSSPPSRSPPPSPHRTPVAGWSGGSCSSASEI
eukprot:14696449-Alexandrium_andersonii.AAC.1